MAEVVSEMIAMVLEEIMIFVFGFPTGATGANNERDIVLGEQKIGSKGNAIEDLAGFLVDNREFAPVDEFCAFASPNGQGVDRAIIPAFVKTSIPNPVREVLNGLNLFE